MCSVEFQEHTSNSSRGSLISLETIDFRSTRYLLDYSVFLDCRIGEIQYAFYRLFFYRFVLLDTAKFAINMKITKGTGERSSR